MRGKITGTSLLTSTPSYSHLNSLTPSPSPSTGARESTAVLVVEDPLFGSGVDRAPPTISSPTPSSQSIPEGLTAQFVCVAFGFPQPTIQWLRNGQVSQSSPSSPSFPSSSSPSFPSSPSSPLVSEGKEWRG